MDSPAANVWRPIGTVLVDSGAITQEDLDAALAEQRLSGRRLGEILIDSGRITWLQLAHGIADQAKDLEPEQTIATQPEPEPEPAPPRPMPADAVSEAAERLETVETMLKERQRAFLELVSVTERLRATVSRLQDELAKRDAEITRLRSSQSVTA